jgi:hypothetical protein
MSAIASAVNHDHIVGLVKKSIEPKSQRILTDIVALTSSHKSCYERYNNALQNEKGKPTIPDLSRMLSGSEIVS